MSYFYPIKSKGTYWYRSRYFIF